MTIAEIIASILLVVATVLVIGTAIALWRAPDALTRVNLLGPTVGLAVPLLLVAKLVVDFAENGFSLWSLIKVMIACFGVWIIASVGSFYMGRSIYGVTVTDVKYAKRMREREQTVKASEDEL
ncbi:MULTISPECIES: Na+/H+ antiporter subunit G [Corynebacterium]|uniref:Cation:proton antiporter n=2 Tax=Corynebacterium TaxID=1716 RepID=A0ACC4UBH9_9CORY|nr:MULTISPECIES: Na+/H+ antiporter subunit G [Corynebacterium]KKO80274.1 cation:proton antiporter [Corynebacterium minutissimum]OFK70078.1 Na+/H+ antiporter subunit G [Corynebacterium sp. HMSC076G08]OFN38590.1 Na+/H+ antiporter subunit G [Corynebacterium sp. HMSC072A04]OFN76712.1 Na+/H+ antiporter subunit G [Corynebacterium sp. HMSC070E08]OFO23447.1 Na+/H+ antiporter subunit G [Corynebacterium sp. HMSC056F09]